MADGGRVGDLTTFGRLQLTGARSLLQLGNHCAIGNVSILLHADVRVGDHVVINDGCTILTATHDTSDPRWPTITAPVIVSDYAWVAMNATLLPGCVIGRGAVVGAGAVVAGDVPDYSIAIGNRATLTSHARPQNLDYDPVQSVAYVNAWLGAKADRQ